MRYSRLILASIICATGVNYAGAQTVDEMLAEGRASFLNYDFENAAKQYAAARKKAKKNIPPQLEEQERELMNAENFLERVEQLVILDSISVPKTDFFKAYRLPFSAGNLGTAT